MLFCPLTLPPSLHTPLQQMDNDTIVCWMIWESLTHHTTPHFRDVIQHQYCVEMSDVFSFHPSLPPPDNVDVLNLLTTAARFAITRGWTCHVDPCMGPYWFHAGDNVFQLPIPYHPSPLTSTPPQPLPRRHRLSQIPQPTLTWKRPSQRSRRRAQQQPPTAPSSCPSPSSSRYPPTRSCSHPMHLSTTHPSHLCRAPYPSRSAPTHPHPHQLRALHPRTYRALNSPSQHPHPHQPRHRPRRRPRHRPWHRPRRRPRHRPWHRPRHRPRHRPWHRPWHRSRHRLHRVLHRLGTTHRLHRVLPILGMTHHLYRVPLSPVAFFTGCFPTGTTHQLPCLLTIPPTKNLPSPVVSPSPSPHPPSDRRGFHCPPHR